MRAGVRRVSPLRLLLAGLLLTLAIAPGPARASIGFRATYDSFAAGQAPSPWREIEYGGTCDGSPSAADRVQPVTSPVAQGAGAMKVVVAPGDRFCSSSGERTLLKESWSNRLDRPVEGTLRYYGFSYFLPEGWVHPYEGTWRWEYIFEEHADSRFIQAPIKIGFQGDALQLRLNTGSCDTNPVCTERILTSPESFATGRWVDVILGVRYTKSSTGFATVWTRVAGRDTSFVKRLEFEGVPTLPYLSGQREPELYVLHGYYRSDSSFTSTLYLDNYSFGDSFEDVLATFEAEAAPPVSPVLEARDPGSSIKAGTTLSGTVSWSVTAGPGTRSVEFWADGRRLATDTSAPFAWSFDTRKLTNGTHALGLAVVDGSGARTTPQIGQVTIWNVKHRTKSSIKAGSTLRRRVTWRVAAPPGTQSVEFWADGRRLATDRSAPFTWSLRTRRLTNGKHALGLAVVDAAGRRTTAQVGTVRVRNHRPLRHRR